MKERYSMGVENPNGSRFVRYTDPSDDSVKKKEREKNLENIEK